MDFTVGKGFEIKGGVARVPADELLNHEITGALDELRAVAEARGLWLPEGAGQIAVAQIVDIEAERVRLLGTVEEGARLFNGAVEVINDGRRKKDQIPVIAPGEYRERAEDWLTDERVSNASLLPETANRPRMVFPKLHRPVTTEEVVTSWDKASDHGLYSWSGRMKFLRNWTADELSGFDPEADDTDRMAITPTAYDEARQGTVAAQMDAKPAELDVTPIFEGAVLARRYKGQNRNWQDSYVRAIDLTSAPVVGFDYVPYAFVRDVGGADAYGSHVRGGNAARLQVR